MDSKIIVSKASLGLRVSNSFCSLIEIEASCQTEQEGHAVEHRPRGDSTEQHVFNRRFVGEPLPPQVTHHDVGSDGDHLQGKVNHQQIDGAGHPHQRDGHRKVDQEIPGVQLSNGQPKISVGTK